MDQLKTARGFYPVKAKGGGKHSKGKSGNRKGKGKGKGNKGCFICGKDHFARDCPDRGKWKPKPKQKSKE